MKKKPRLKSFLLIMSLVLAVMTPIQVFAAENAGSVAESNTKQLYTIRNTTYENGSGVKKGNSHDCQHLGVWIKKDTVLKVRQTNANFKQNLTLRLRNDDSKTENSVTIPANGSWVSITALADGVPFVTSVYSSNGQRPVVEWKTEGGGELYNLPVYDYEDEERSEKAFYQMWNDTDAPFAVMECRRAVLLVPKCDKTKNGFKSLDRLLEYYNEMVDQYNLFAGLVSKDSPEAKTCPWDVDSETRFFVKANKNGVGLAYYGSNECGYNSKSMDGFLTYGWVLNHEVGHGYKTPAGIGTQGEIWNNVFGHYYQHTIENKSDWGGVDNDAKRKSYETGQPYPGGSSYGRSLYFWTNMFDKIGPQYTISNFYKQYRYDKYSPNSTVNPDTGWDYYSKSFTKISGYNVIPYFEKWGLYGQEASKNEIIEAGVYKNVYPLGQLSGKEETLATVNRDLNLGSNYALVETQELVKYGQFSGTAEFTFDDASFEVLRDKKITITDGVNTVKEVIINDKTVNVTLPIGVYNVLLDKQADKIGINNSRGFLVIREGETKTYSVTVNQSYADSLANTVIRFNGLSFVNYFTATYDPVKMQVRMKTENKVPHSTFANGENVLYSSITLYDDKGNVLYTKDHIAKIASPEDKTFDIEEGYRVQVYHHNDSKVQSRNQIVYSYGGNATPVALENTVTYEFTKKGLKRVVSSKPMTDAELNENYYKTLTAYFDSLIKKTDSASWKDGESLLEEKSIISAAYEVLTAEQKNKFKTAYSAYFPFENTISTWEVGTIPDQTYTGSPIVPDVTVRSSNGTILKKGTDYKVTFSNNENVGTAQAVVTGLGSYKNFISKINFNIVLGNVDFTAAVDQKEYNYNGYKVTPSMAVKDNGRVLERNVDYKIIYKNNINVGTATAIAKGIGNYEGFESQDTFTIKGYAPGIKITVAPKKAVYNGETITAAVTVYDATYPSSGTKTLKAGVDYTVAGNSAVNVGKHTITVNGIGNYSGVAATGAFEITESANTAIPDTTELANYRFDLKGYNNYTYAKLYVDIEKGDCKLVEEKRQPHNYFKEQVYSYVRIYDQNGAQLLYAEQLGNHTLARNTHTCDIGIGCVIELFHKEPKNRAVIVPEYDYNNQDTTNRIRVTDNVTKYIVTNTGINRIYPIDKKTDSQKAFYDSLIKYTDKYLSANYTGELYDNEDYIWDAVINKSLILLSDGNKASFTAKYNKKYKVTLDNKGGTSVTELVRDIRSGSKKTAVSVPTKTGYIFAGYYDAADGGTKYYNKDGNPTTETWNLTGNITLYAQWTAAAKETTPETVFSAETMKLTGVTSDMKYRVDEGEWIDADGSDDITLNICEACTISVVKKGNGTTTIDSAEQIITVAKAETPTLTAAQPEGIDGKGSIPTTEAHEFSEDGINYTECAGPTDDLEPGIYYVRVAANGTVLASDAQEITISAFNPNVGATPNASFSAETMKLTGVTSGMKYRIDNGEWIDVDGSDDITLNIFEACTISVVKKGNGTTTIDSAEQIITVTKAETPTLTAAQPEGIDGKGSIPTTEAHEFSEDGINYTECAGPTDDLEPGTYYVRVAASGTALASDAQEIIINAFVQGKETTPNAAFSAETMKLTGVTSGMKYRIDNGEWIDVDGSDDITLNISEACTISVVKKGNGTTTIDSAEQIITVTKAETPTLTAAQPEGIDGKGSIPTTEVHEFSEDGINYTECAGPTDDLEPGTYYVRVAASGTALASDAQEITISAFTTPDEPTPDEPTPDEPTPDDNPTINNTVYFNANGGSVTPDSAETSEEGRLSILPTPTRNGYTFDGWYVEEAGGTEVTTDTVFDADTTIYAHWTANPVIDGGSAGGGGMIVAPIILPEQPSTEPTQSGNATTIDLSEDTVNKGGRTTTTVDKQVADKLVKVAVKNKSEEIVIIAVTKNKIKASNTKSSEVSLPAESLQTIAERTDANILIKTDVAEVKLDNKAVEAVASQIQAGTIGKDETVTIIAEKVKEESKEVRFEVKILTSKGICISDFNGGNAVVTVNVPKSFSNKETVCVYIDANGFMHKVDGGINADGTYSFTTGHFSTYSIMSEEEADAAIREQKEAVKVIKLKLRSELVKTKSGKKVIKLKWTNPSDIELEGVEIYRSLKKNSGYGRKPIYISKSGKYINTAVKTGKRYYYKVRGFVTIDGEKIYTEYSAKSYRTVK